jgi:hypothetical protein
MIVYPGMIAQAAQQAGMKVPEDPDGEWNVEEYPYFNIFCVVQLGRRIRWGEHWDNAKVVAAIPEEKLATVTLMDLIESGLEYST